MGRPLRNPATKEFAGSVTGHGTATEITLQVTSGRACVFEVVSVECTRASGDAANWAPKIGVVATFVTGSINDRVSFASAAVGTRINESIDPPKVLTSDANGRAYFRFGWDAGSNNAGSYKITVRILELG